LAAIPYQEHVKWSQQMQKMVVDGSPVWQVHRSVDIWSSVDSSGIASASSSSSSSDTNSTSQLIITDEVGLLSSNSRDTVTYHLLLSQFKTNVCCISSDAADT